MDSTDKVRREDDTKRPLRLLGISDFSDDLIGKVFEFLGHGQFLFVAGTCQQFHRVYKATWENENNKTTAMRSVIESISRLQWSNAIGCPWNELTFYVDIWTASYGPPCYRNAALPRHRQ